MTLTRRDPNRDVISLPDVFDRMFRDSFLWPRGWPRTLVEGVSPALDVVETDEALVVKAALPGVTAEDVDVTIGGDMLSISGSYRREEEGPKGEGKGATYHFRELERGAFERTVRLPVAVEADKAAATFEDGLLTLTLPKAMASKRTKVEVKPSASPKTAS